MIPAESSPAKLFSKLFVADSPEDQAVQVERLKEGRSIMDVVAADAKTLQGSLGAGDRDKMDQYFESVRAFEKRLGSSEDWAQKPKPVVKMKLPRHIPGSNQTNVLLTSNLGNASAHDNKNMPVLFAGGGFRHGQHLAFNKDDNYPLPNLYVSALQRQGLETDRFATGTGTMSGLEMV